MLKSLIKSYFKNGEAEPVIIATIIGVAVFLSFLLLAKAAYSRSALRRRATASLELGAGGGGHSRSLDYRQDRRVGELLEKAGSLFSPNSKTDVAEMRRQLIQAGFFSSSALPIFYGIRIALACVLPIVFLALSSLFALDVPAALTLVLSCTLLVCGLIVPSVLLDRRRAAMRLRYRQAFPDFMDLMVVCVESGQGLHGAFERVGKEIMQSCPALGANIHIVNLELRAGRTLVESLDGLYDRLGIDEVKSFRLLLKQSEELGTSIATSMRVYSDEMRDKRLIMAETKAHALPVKMTIPLGMFIFPVILLVIMVPVIIRIKDAGLF